MDSLTQIVLGAACGEAVLGKKIGNKALLFGAVGGTIPDLDVFIGSLLYSNEIDAMLFHRGIMHSVFFSLIGALIFGWITYSLYNGGKRLGTTTYLNWVNLYIWSLFTHLILDCFTPYGTQLFAPFSNYRVAFNSIAVVDPLYTIPFLVCLIILMFLKRQNKTRQFWLKLGLGISSAYLLLTVFNKILVDQIFRSSLKRNGITYTRYSVQPTIINNILWYGIAESKNNYYAGFYSILDTQNQFSDWQTIPKTRALTKTNYFDIKDLAWFSNHYYTIEVADSNYYTYRDLRYPLVETRTGFKAVFNLKLFKTENRLNMKPFEPEMNDFGHTLDALWRRLKGK
ncbi:MAG: metal-dependent hydrolase [Winogradskyella sp.]|uniref:metal-dependent hydrolase n=1 Tax=Winogradskyella sp. TaxID=1883156 RepID=UPI00179445A9|nr:metal-dependent hydrolase [Winogradskyella sp.]